MKELSLHSIVIRKKPKYKKGDCYKKFDNLVKQNFTVDAPNKVWCTDFTYMWLEDGQNVIIVLSLIYSIVLLLLR